MVQVPSVAGTTPGPLIMVIRYAGFVGAWHQGVDPRLGYAILDALVTTYVTFLPCCLFIFEGAPAIEALANNRRLQAALVSITAAEPHPMTSLPARYTGSAMSHRLHQLPAVRRITPLLDRWRRFAGSALGQRLMPLYVVLAGGALGALVADRLVRSMWRHALFTGPEQWRTVAIILTALWVLIGAVAALAMLGSPGDEATASPDAAGIES